MKKNKINLDQLEQDFLIKKFVDHNNLVVNNPKITIIESPIVSVSNKQMGPGQSIPDAIIQYENEDKSFLELTTFSRSQAMRAQIGEIAKYPERFKNQRFISGITDFVPLEIGFHEALSKKMYKDYSQFSVLKSLPSLGILLIILRNNDPFFNEAEYNRLISIIEDPEILSSWGVDQGQFKKIIFGGFVDINYQWVDKFPEIADFEKIKKIKNKVEIRKDF